ncbi:site-specific DNA-methyltransferase [Pseudomonas sp. NBRC 111133]|uniref:DNA-methyltransferase n=1 Tax=Pseudomonas sp. NBRC 111133 TaxID=1661048 RepID=UPI00076206E8|nr:site-specific DNA-methyltransferase [Pseudomonas sp. NBRC 111133]
MTQQHRILVGDCIEMMRTLPDQSAHTCITSPPYFGLRDYGVDGQIGLEASPREFIENLVQVFREVRRVLRDDGTLWVNMGDSYAGSWGAHGRDDMGLGVSSLSARQVAASARKAKKPNHGGFKPKDLMGMPWRLAFALQDDGWYLRQDIIWHKPNPMPESVRDRCTKAHEYLFLLSKGPKYFFDQEAIREPANLTGKGSANTFRGGAYCQGSTFDNSAGGNRTVSGNTVPRNNGVGWGHGSKPKPRTVGSKRNSFARETKYSDGDHGQTGQHRADREDIDYDTTRNKRSVWSVATNGFKGAHFATFPPELIRPCILASAPRGGLVLDPFGGAGTTSLVAMQEGRQSVICELNPEYAALARQRLDTAWIEGAAQMDFLLDQSPAA